MFLGHHAVGFASKRLAPNVSLGWLIAAPILVDVLWPVFLLLGWEQVRVDPGNTAFTPLAFVHYPITHSLLSGVVWGGVLGSIYWLKARDTRGALVIAAGVVSHWVMDWITHRPDLPLYPGGAEYGLGLWNSIAGTLIVELIIFAAGVWAYVSMTRPIGKAGRYPLVAYIVFLFVIYFSGMFAPPPPDERSIAFAGLAQLLFIPWAWWFDRHRVVKQRAAPNVPMNLRISAVLVVVAAAAIGACTDRGRRAEAPETVRSAEGADTASATLFPGDTIPRLLQLADTTNVLTVEELGGDAGGPWWALDAGAPASLRRVDVYVRRVPHPCFADDSVRLGRTLSIAGGGGALALLRGIPGLRAGPIVNGTLDSVYAAPESPAGGTDSARVTFAGRPLRIWRTPLDQGFQVEVEWNARRDVVFSTDFEDEGSWDVVLVADVNRDEAPDLLLQATSKYSVRVLRLLLFQPGAERRYREIATSRQSAC